MMRFVARNIFIRTIIACTLLAVGLFYPTTLLAASGQIIAILDQPQLTPRSHALTQINWQLENRGQSIVEGRISITLRLNGRNYMHLDSQELVVNAGKQTIPMSIPCPIDGIGDGFALVRAEFVKTNGVKIKLGDHQIRFGPSTMRAFSLGHFSSELEAVANSNQKSNFYSSFQLERFSPKNQDSRSQNKENGLTSIWTRAKTEDLPRITLNLCSYDIIVLTESTLAEITKQQRDALNNWVRAGGALCLSLPEEVAAEAAKNAEFLLNIESDTPMFLPGQGGKFVPADEYLAKKFHPAQIGWGRVVAILGTHEDKVYKSPEWEQMIRFLWRIRNDQTKSLVDKNVWNVPQPDQEYLNFSQYGYYNMGVNQFARNQLIEERASKKYSLPFFNWPLSSAQQITQRLLPNEIRIIPISQIAFMLFVYVMIVGPGEYIVLGRLKIRNWTWVTFPIITVVFTFAMIQYINSYMSSDTQRRAIDIVDIDTEGNTVRRNRYELLFPNRSQYMETPLPNSTFAHMDASTLGNIYNYRANQPSSQNTPNIVGLYPARSMAIQLVPKWTPQLNRTLTFQPQLPADFPGQKFDWSLIHDYILRDKKGPREKVKVKEAQDKFKNEMKKSFGNDFAVYEIIGTERSTDENDQLKKPSVKLIVNSGTIFRLQPSDYGNNYNNQVYYQQMQRSGVDASNMLTPFWGDITGRSQFGLFSLLTQISPSGGGYFDDLAVIDPSDPSQRVLMIVVPYQNDYVVLRQYLHEQPSLFALPDTDHKEQNGEPEKTEVTAKENPESETSANPEPETSPETEPITVQRTNRIPAPAEPEPVPTNKSDEQQPSE